MQPALLPAVEARREDLYTGIHKAMRALLCDTLVAVGRMDRADEAEAARTMSRVRLVIELGRHHLHHENQHIHPVLEARRRGAAAASASEHTGHLQAFERLEAHALRVERSQGKERDAAALELYRELALHCARDFLHMHAEETENNAILWQHCSDSELKAVHQAIVSSVGPRQMTEYLVWLARAMTPGECADLLSGMRQAMPSEIFAGVAQLVKSVLSERDWAKVIGALGSRPLAV